MKKKRKDFAFILRKGLDASRNNPYSWRRSLSRSLERSRSCSAVNRFTHQPRQEKLSKTPSSLLCPRTICVTANVFHCLRRFKGKLVARAQNIRQGLWREAGKIQERSEWPRERGEQIHFKKSHTGFRGDGRKRVWGMGWCWGRVPTSP